MTVDLFLSADGWAKGVASPGYFGYHGPDLERWITEARTPGERILLGRRTFDALNGLPQEYRDKGFRRMAAAPTTVFSTALESVPWPGAEVARVDPAEYVRSAADDVPLRTMGSLSIVRQLLDVGLVGRMRLLFFPCLVGAGGREAPFEGVRSADLEVTDRRLLDGRIVLVEYRPTGRPAPAA
ncbi:dihydrofolate reductase family protein [Tsukamurella sp. 8F]|uniref:dihydrofolate reductase family protein n=1 Tax=unclassified Tsukamurella TaxID=2633480 RepID=UPI0023B9E494|nr:MULTISPECIES: dihydrofolate reductase family protein [unclassified Tsukamurella]MDF0528531.1 dihydrofolate reductase family protein [Tsukamurella sp. 8J]MDF0586357.1 dihydrofolate reductase family protein [Tsukamurella sp. 8F]